MNLSKTITKSTGILSAAIMMASLSITPAYAYTIPTFPTCETPPSGSGVIASNGTGTHGIVGSSSDHVGNDVVYSIPGTSQVMQCFCGTDGGGIQTNWIDVASLSDADRNFLHSSGWTFIPDGTQWGLSSDPYMTINSSYTCKGGGGGSSGGGGTSGGGSSSSSSNNNSNNNNGGGQVLGISTDPGQLGEVLGLADTGAQRETVILATSIALIAVGAFALRKSFLD